MSIWDDLNARRVALGPGSAAGWWSRSGRRGRGRRPAGRSRRLRRDERGVRPLVPGRPTHPLRRQARPCSPRTAGVDPGDRVLATARGGGDELAAWLAAIRETVEEAGIAIGLKVADGALPGLRAALHDGVALGPALAEKAQRQGRTVVCPHPQDPH